MQEPYISPNERDVPSEEMRDFDSEYEDVKRINKRMERARENWEPPEEPCTEEDDSSQAYFSGVVRSIEVSKSDAYYNNSDYESRVKFYLDTGESELVEVGVWDTGEYSMSNPYVRVCKYYQVSPDRVDDFYGKTLEVYSRYNKIIKSPKMPFVKPLFEVWMAHFRHGFFSYSKKDIGEGKVATLRFIVTYGILFLSTLIVTSVNPAFSLVSIPLFILFGWGITSKLRYDVAPRVSEWVEYYGSLRNRERVDEFS